MSQSATLSAIASGSVESIGAPWPRRAPVETFLQTSGERLERRVEEVCSDLGRELGGLQGVLASAVGTRGRGGRRWRPLLTLAAAEAFRPPHAHRSDVSAEVLDVAVAIELTHTASLVLDDLPCMDDTPVRRGQPATHRLVGSAGAILLSVGLLARAVELLGRSSVQGAVLCAEWGRAIGLGGMAGGQAMDVAASTKKLFGAERRLHRAKSTLLPAFALSSGAQLGGADRATCERLGAFGRSLGWAYQLRDDAEDLAEDARLGKPPAGTRPLGQSQRIMVRALHRLRRLPPACSAGADLLVEVTDRLVVPGTAANWQRTARAAARSLD